MRSTRKADGRRRYTDHTQVAATARANPGTWVRASVHGTAYGTNSTIRYVTAGTRLGARAYLPAGAFEAETRTVEMGVEVWVRYVGTPDEEVTAR